MRILSLIWTHSLLILCPALVESACDPPISIPIGLVNITDGNMIKYGLGLKIGTPPQTVSVDIHPDYNNTFIWGLNGECEDPWGKTSEMQCHWGHGGSFTTTDSDTWKPSEPNQVEYVPQSTEENFYSIGSWGTDSMKLEPNITLEGFPFYKGTSWTVGFTGLGLGTRSTFLDALYKQKKIFSKTWSLFYGWQQVPKSQQLDGSLVLGGYDKAKITGNNFTGPMSTLSLGQCPSRMSLSIRQITVHHVNGTDVDLLAANNPMEACLLPQNLRNTLRKDALAALKATLPGKRISPPRSERIETRILYEAADAFQGNLTYTLPSNVKITIPNHQLVTPTMEIDEKGAAYVVEGSKTVNIYVGDEPFTPHLGQIFMSAAYLFVDHDLEQFTLWAANPTADTDLVTVAQGSSCSEPNPSSTKTGTGQSSNRETGTGNGGSTSTSSGLGAGPIAGIVIGVVAAVAVAAGAFFFLRRRHKYKNIKSAPPAVDMKIPFGNPPREVDAGPAQQIRAELPGQGFWAHHELPAEPPKAPDQGRNGSTL
ncbi:hypothetical protein FQN57_000118 [Myotisia sp. PD_48]|nr:hypothetical protein FQN57_000118 [Myotisia sp. PD_48]